MPTFINLTNAAVPIRVGGTTRLTIAPDGRLPYVQYQTDVSEGITLSTDDAGNPVLLAQKPQRIVGVLLTADPSSGKYEVFPSKADDVYYIVPAAIAWQLRRTDVGWIDNTTDTNNSTYYPGRAG